MRDKAVFVGEDGVGERIDRYLAAQGDPFISRSYVQDLIAQGLVQVNGHVCRRASKRLAAGDCIVASIPPPPKGRPEPEDIPLDIVYEDAAVIVVNKPRGMVVHPAPGHDSGTLVHGLLAYDPSLAGVGETDRPGIVHRLDKETSGLIVVARNAAAHRYLIAQLKARTVGRYYLAFVQGVVPDERWTVDAPIGRDPVRRQRMAVVPTGKPAVTHFETVETYNAASLVRADLVTGRTHQIRVHMAHVGHPVIGDVRYGAAKGVFAGQALHAYRLTLRHPETGRLLDLQVPLPEDLVELQRRLRAS